MPKVTVGIPVYNGSNYLGAAIDSILAQSFGDFELIISDNASTDQTEDICRAYASGDKRIRYIRQQTNLGSAGNHNAIVSMSEAPYFKWAAHDDTLAPGFLAACVDALDQRPHVVLASPASDHIDEYGQVLPYSSERGGVVDRAGVCWPSLPEDNWNLAAADPTLRFEAVMLNMFMCVEIFGLMRRSALLRTGLQGPYSGADKVVLAKMSLLGPFWLGRETLFHRRSHSEQYSSSLSASYRAEWFSGRRDSMLVQQLKLLMAYCDALSTTELTVRQRLSCLQSIVRRAVGRGQHWRRLTGALVGNP
jgi:glycosyltransferase involved in cell wall biosynthesis